MEEQTARQAVAGDRQAIETLIRANYSQLYKTAFLYVKNESDALDIIQDSFIKIIKQIHTLENPRYFTTWAVRIVIFTALDHLRKKQPEELEAQYATPEKPLSAEERLDIQAALAKLPEHLREITILFYFQGLKIAEISSILQEPPGTIKYKLHEARRILKDYLKGDGEDEF